MELSKRSGPQEKIDWTSKYLAAPLKAVNTQQATGTKGGGGHTGTPPHKIII
jgi:hypothetical protein